MNLRGRAAARRGAGGGHTYGTPPRRTTASSASVVCPPPGRKLWDLFDSRGIVGQNPKSKKALLNLVVILELRINL